MTVQQPAVDRIALESGRTVPLYASFDRVLDLIDILRAADLDEGDRLKVACSILFGKARLSRSEQAEALNEAVSLLFAPPTGEPGPKAFDFQQDSELLYAAFRQAYDIDLDAERGHLHWLHFLALLAGLPDDTKLSQVISIRLRPIPKPTKYNREEIRQLLKLKAKYRLKLTPEEETQQFQRGLQKVAQSLMNGR